MKKIMDTVFFLYREYQPATNGETTFTAILQLEFVEERVPLCLLSARNEEYIIFRFPVEQAR